MSKASASVSMGGAACLFPAKATAQAATGQTWLPALSLSPRSDPAACHTARETQAFKKAPLRTQHWALVSQPAWGPPLHLPLAADTGQDDTLVPEPSASCVVTIFKSNLAENSLNWKWFKMLTVEKKFQICFSQSAGISLCLQLNPGVKEN